MAFCIVYKCAAFHYRDWIESSAIKLHAWGSNKQVATLYIIFTLMHDIGVGSKLEV